MSERRKRVFRIVVPLLIAVVLSAGLPKAAEAQLQDVSWSEPYPLSSGQGEVSGASLVADPYGYVHAFWSEQNPEENYSILQYARFDGEKWSTPVDIYATTATYALNAKAATIDSAGILHLAWSLGSQGPIYYTTAPAYDALSIKMWKEPVLIDFPAWRVSLQVGTNGELHLLYIKDSGNDRGIYYTNSVNGGLTWQIPIWLDPDIPPTYVPGGGGMKMDDNNGLHVLWYYLDLEDPAAPARWIRYTYSPDGGVTWDTPSTIDRDLTNDGSLRVAGPLMAIQGNTVQVVWAGGDEPYRRYSYSQIGSSVWSTPVEKIFGDLLGQAGDSLAEDALGRLHYIGQIRYPQGIYHSILFNGRWSLPTLVYLIASDASDPIGNRIHAHGISAAFRLGNQLVITFFDRKESQNVQLYAMYKTFSDVPATPPQNTPVHVEPTQGNPSAGTPIVVGTLTTSVANALPGFNTDLPNSNVSPADPIFIGLLVAILLVGGALGWQSIRRR